MSEGISPAVREHYRRSREASGLPDRIADPGVRAQLRALLRESAEYLAEREAEVPNGRRAAKKGRRERRPAKRGAGGSLKAGVS